MFVLMLFPIWESCSLGKSSKKKTFWLAACLRQFLEQRDKLSNRAEKTVLVALQTDTLWASCTKKALGRSEWAKKRRASFLLARRLGDLRAPKWHQFESSLSCQRLSVAESGSVCIELH